MNDKTARIVIRVEGVGSRACHPEAVVDPDVAMAWIELAKILKINLVEMARDIIEDALRNKLDDIREGVAT